MDEDNKYGNHSSGGFNYQTRKGLNLLSLSMTAAVASLNATAMATVNAAIMQLKDTKRGNTPYGPQGHRKFTTPKTLGRKR